MDDAHRESKDVMLIKQMDNAQPVLMDIHFQLVFVYHFLLTIAHYKLMEYARNVKFHMY